MGKRVRAILATGFVVVLLTMTGGGAAGAQEFPEGCVETPLSPDCVDVGGESETPTETETEAVQGVTVDRTPQVAGVQTQRPLPRTGNDIGGTALFGGALTVLGVALALGARKRRNSFDGV
jgi:LPXTG-motif cell wall-anchored protein